ncbi:MAG TPA: alpha/beta hydrolase [Longimicrobiales bacterium]|nr:alpha/beta hydrolase [Longimicrobiales bacterium]
MERPEMRQTRIGEFRIQSEHLGAGPPVVLLHGLSGSCRWWRFTTPALARRYSVHVPELVGFGGSRRPGRQPDVPELADVMAQWLDEMGLTDIALVGHSMGGQIALHIAAEHHMPGRLVLVSASGLPREWSLRDAGRFVARALPPRSWGAPAFVPTIAVDALRAGPRALLLAARHLLGDDVTPLLPLISCPTLLIWGELDPLVPLKHGRAMFEGIAGARLVVLRDAAHNPMADRPVEFNRVLLEFLDS